MMIIGSVGAFVAAQMSGSAYVGLVAGIAGGAVFSLLFAFLTLTLVANQLPRASRLPSSVSAHPA